jgi:hypothetical protein
MPMSYNKTVTLRIENTVKLGYTVKIINKTLTRSINIIPILLVQNTTLLILMG